MHIDAIFCERIPNEYIYTIFLLIHTKCNLEAKKRKTKSYRINKRSPFLIHELEMLILIFIFGIFIAFVLCAFDCDV